MNREAFMAKLREGLRGLPQAAIDEYAADYEAHFVEGLADGRTEAEVTRALGDPTRLARELRAEAGLKRWEQERTPNAAAGAIFAVLGLVTIDILILLPVLMAVGGALFGFFMGSIGIFIAGGAVFVAGLFGAGPAPAVASALAGVGMMSAATATAALITLVVIGLVNVLVRYGRLHYRLLQPAVQS